MVVQHNLTAMNSNRMLGITTGTQAKSTEKLSSGYKINRAADDAAGLSISEKMRKQIRGLSQASLNAEDGISAVQTAEGALNEVQDMLQRMNELAVKAANGTMSENDRSYIQDEIKALETEIDRVAETTKFNETYLLKGDKNTSPAKDYQYKNVTEAAFVAGTTTLYTAKEGGGYDTIDEVSELKDALAAGKELIKTQATEAEEADTDDYDTYAELATDAKAAGKLFKTGVSGSWGKTTDATTNKDTWKIAITDTEVGSVAENGSIGISIGGVEFKLDRASGAGALSADDLKALVEGADVAAITATSGNESIESIEVVDTAAGFEVVVVAKSAGDYANTDLYNEDGEVAIADGAKLTTAQKNGIGDYTSTRATEDVKAVAGTHYTEPVKAALYDKDGNEVSANGLQFYYEDGAYTGGLYTDKEGNTPVADITTYVDDTQTKTGALTLKLHVGADATDNNQITIDIEALNAEGLGIKDISVDGADDTNARDAIRMVKEAIQQVSRQRSALGATQNRLEHTILNLDNIVENTTAAESQIRDTDMATEMVRYSNNNILAQAGQAMLAQANQSNQGVLSLLG